MPHPNQTTHQTQPTRENGQDFEKEENIKREDDFEMAYDGGFRIVTDSKVREQGGSCARTHPPPGLARASWGRVDGAHPAHPHAPPAIAPLNPRRSPHPPLPQTTTKTQSLLYLFGMKLDYSSALIGGGFQFHNPNAAESCGCGKSFGV